MKWLKRTLGTLLLLHSLGHVFAFSPKPKPYPKLSDYLFQQASRDTFDGSAQNNPWTFGLGQDAIHSQNFLQIVRKWKNLHALEGAFSCTSSFKFTSLSYQFHLSAYTSLFQKPKINEIWSVTGISGRSLFAGFRYHFGPSAYSFGWVEHGLSYPFETKKIQSHLRFGISFRSEAFHPNVRETVRISRKSTSFGTTYDAPASEGCLRVWGGIAYLRNEKQWGSHWNAAWVPRTALGGLIQTRCTIDRFSTRTTFHFAADLCTSLLPESAAYHVAFSLGPECLIEQTAARGGSPQLGFSIQLHASRNVGEYFRPYFQLQIQTHPRRIYRLGYGTSMLLQGKEGEALRFFSDLAEWVLGVPNIGVRLPSSGYFPSELHLSSAWFESKRRTHRFQAVRINVLFPEKSFFGVFPSIHLRGFQYDLRFANQGEMGSAWELGIGLSRPLPRMNARLQLDAGVVFLRQKPYQWVPPYAVQGEYAQTRTYFGPTALRYIHYWGKNTKKRSK